MASRLEHNQFQTQLIDLFIQALQFALIVVYFRAWSVKSRLRHHLRFGFLTFLSLSNLLLIAELIIEWQKPAYIGYIIHHLKEYHNFIFSVFIISIIYLFYDHIKEAKHRGYEYVFVRHVLSFLGRPQRGAPTVDSCIQGAVELFHSCFERAQIISASVHRRVGDTLEIKDIYIYPRTTHSLYFLPLTKGVGVAGRVFDDERPRYVPRLHFPFAKRWVWLPTAYFPHAVVYELGRGDKNQYLVRASALDHFVFKTHPPQNPCGICNEHQWKASLTGKWICGACRTPAPLPSSERLPFRSLLSVPIKFENDTKKTFYGVLNFDFAKQDPLDPSDIAMAVTFGILLAEALERLESP